MAQRNFWKIENGLVVKGIEDFKWEPGMSTAQRRRSCINLHNVLKGKGFSPLDISSASTEELGVNLSAFNLKWNGRTVECWYQGSKVYKNAGVQHRLYNVSSLEAKKSMKALAGDQLIGFNLDGIDFPMSPKTVFYDWIYLNGLIQSYGKELDLSEYDCFTDIQAVINIDACQAKTVCMYTLLQRQDNFDTVMKDFNSFLRWHITYVKC